MYYTFQITIIIYKLITVYKPLCHLFLAHCHQHTAVIKEG